MAAAYAWARPSIVSVSRVHGHTPLLGISPSGRWRLWLLSVGDRFEIDGSRSRRRLWSAAAPDASYRRGFRSSRMVTVRASHVNSAGSIDSPLMQSMADKIKEHLNAEFVDVKDAYGDGRHVRIPAVISQPPRVLLQLDELPLEISPFLSKSGRNIQFPLKCLVSILAAATGYELITDHHFFINPITAAGIESDYVIDSIDVVASSFEGQSAVTRQRMVYKAIWEELQSTVHAVDQMTTRTPGEAQAATD